MTDVRVERCWNGKETYYRLLVKLPTGYDRVNLYGHEDWDRNTGKEARTLLEDTLGLNRKHIRFV